MSAPGDANLRRGLAAARERLAALAERVARVRSRLGGAGAATAAAAERPFAGADERPIDDLELNFRAVDAEGASDAGSDQNKVR